MRIKLIGNPYESCGIKEINDNLILPQIIDVEEDYNFGMKEGIPYKVGGVVYLNATHIGCTDPCFDKEWLIPPDCYEVLECKILSTFQHALAKLEMSLFKQDLMLKNHNWNINRNIIEREKQLCQLTQPWW